MAQWRQDSRPMNGAFTAIMGDGSEKVFDNPPGRLQLYDSEIGLPTGLVVATGDSVTEVFGGSGARLSQSDRPLLINSFARSGEVKKIRHGR